MSGNVVAWVYDHYPVETAIDRNRKMILSEVAESANRDFEEAHPGVAKIAQHWGFDPKTVRRHLQVLVGEGWLEVTEQGGGRGKATVYRVCRERGAQRPRLVNGNADIPDAKGGHSETVTRTIPDSPHMSQTNSPLDPPAAALPIDAPSSVEQVFAAWCEAAGKTATTRLLDGRRRAIEKALKGYPLDEVLDAVRGWKNDPWHNGQNDRGTAVNELEYLLRGANVEKFRDLWRSPPPSRNGSAASAAPDQKLDMIAEHFGVERRTS